MLAQKVNATELSKALEAEQDERTKASIEALIAKQRNGTLTVEYRRKQKGEGRWYATGRAQLQSCKREVRTAALKGLGWEVDLRASYPMIVVGLMRNIARTGEKTAQTEAIIEEYVRETDKVRRQVAEIIAPARKRRRSCSIH